MDAAEQPICLPRLCHYRLALLPPSMMQTVLSTETTSFDKHRNLLLRLDSGLPLRRRDESSFESSLVEATHPQTEDGACRVVGNAPLQ